jgi:hypothetical protein
MRQKLLLTGIRIPARVVAVQRFVEPAAPRKRGKPAPVRTHFVVTAQGTDPRYAITHNFSQRTAAAHFRLGDRVQIVLHPTKRRRYYLLLD